MKLSLLFLFTSASLLFVSCNKDNSELTLDQYVESAEVDIETQTRSGSGSCFELVFPITLDFPDGTSVEVEDKENVKTTIKDWRSANMDVPGRVKVQFPIEVISPDGEVITVESRLELFRLRKDCIDRPGKDRKPCFRLQYPVTIVFPDGTTQTYPSRRALKIDLRKWRRENPNADTRPMLSFPITIITKEADELVMESREDLAAYKESCD